MFDDETIDYFVVNDEEQYPLWPADGEPLASRYAVGDARPRDECLTYIEHVGTNMRPKSVRPAHEKQSST